MKRQKRFGKLRLSKAIADTMLEAPGKYARILADEMGLTGEDRYMFIWRVEQAGSIQEMLAIIGAITLIVTPYVVVKAITK